MGCEGHALGGVVQKRGVASGDYFNSCVDSFMSVCSSSMERKPNLRVIIHKFGLSHEDGDKMLETKQNISGSY